MRHFTVAEAEAMIPEIESIFEAVAELAAQAETKAASLKARAEDADPAATAIERSQLQFLTAAINEQLAKIVALGALPKGVAPALVDFPSRLDGRDAYLCWKLGEKKITHWHGTDEGFSARKPLPKKRAA